MTRAHKRRAITAEVSGGARAGDAGNQRRCARVGVETAIAMDGLTRLVANATRPAGAGFTRVVDGMPRLSQHLQQRPVLGYMQHLSAGCDDNIERCSLPRRFFDPAPGISPRARNRQANAQRPPRWRLSCAQDHSRKCARPRAALRGAGDVEAVAPREIGRHMSAPASCVTTSR